MKRLLARYRVDTDPLRSERRVELVLLATVALLLLTVLYVALRIAMATTIRPLAPAPDSVRVVALQGAAALPAGEREAIVRRPLFWAGRRPVEAAAPPAEAVAQGAAEERAAAPRLKDVTVRGIYGSGDSGGVILTVKDRELRLAVGEEIEGWRLDRVDGNSATFVSGGARDRRELVPAVIEVAAESAAQAAMPDDPEPASGEAGGEERLTLGGS